jgi:hypothetical protein
MEGRASFLFGVGDAPTHATPRVQRGVVKPPRSLKRGDQMVCVRGPQRRRTKGKGRRADPKTGPLRSCGFQELTSAA